MTQIISKARKPFQPSVSLRLTAFWLLLQSAHTASEGVARGKRASKTAKSLRGRSSAGLSGFFPALPDGYALLDPGWWRATTPPPTTPAPKKNGTNVKANVTQKPPAKKKFVVPSAEELFNVQADTCTTFLNMPGTFAANKKYWESECKGIPKNSTYIKIMMGDVTEYFRPKAKNTNMCQMLTSSNLHSWSSDGETWATPDYGAATQLGGSALNWPAKASATDKRSELSVWGNAGTQQLSGGCCHSDKSAQGKAWGKPYKMAHCGVAKTYGAVCTPLTTVLGTTHATIAYWANLCKQVPITASYIKMITGVFVDYYKPPTGKTYCDMLTMDGGKTPIHKWSPDGENWKILPRIHPNFIGGSAHGQVGKDRIFPTFWGGVYVAGGFGQESPSDPVGFHKTFTMSWCEVERPPPIAQLVAEMHKTEKVVESLETKLDTLHARLLAGEKVSVDAAGNVSLAREGIYKLATKFLDEEGAMKQIAWVASISNTSLLSVQNELMPAARRVRSDARKLERAAQIANETATPPAMTKHEGLNKKIWKLLDPKDPNRLDVTEKNMGLLKQDVDKFRGELGGEIKKIMVTKLRRSVHKLRKALKRLGTTAHRRQSKTAQLGDVDGSERLGANLGLGEEE